MSQERVKAQPELSSYSESVLKVASGKARTYGDRYVRSDHLLGALSESNDIQVLLGKIGKKLTLPAPRINRSKDVDTNADLEYTPDVQNILTDASNLTNRSNSLKEVQPSNIFYAIFLSKDSMAYETLQASGINQSDIRRVLNMPKIIEKAGNEMPSNIYQDFTRRRREQMKQLPFNS